MATKYASATGNWSTMTWWTTSGGSTTTTAPGVGDDANLNGFAVTIDQNVTCDKIVGAGSMPISSSRTITAQMGDAASTWGSNSQITGAGTVVNFIGEFVATSRTTIGFAVNTGATVNVTGNVSGATPNAGNNPTLRNVGGTLNITGNIVGGTYQTQTTQYAVQHTSGTTTIIGNVTGGTTANLASSAILITTGTVNVTGNIVDATASAVSKAGGTLNYTPTASQTVTIGGKVMYPTSGGVSSARIFNGM